jgi:3-oxoacyl-[acyl-carrier-protein] synthase III
VPADIRRLLERNEVTADEVKLFVMHQGSRYIVKTIADRLEQPAGKFPIEIEHCGNAVSSSIPLVIESRLQDPSLDKVVLSGFGVGLSWASCLCARAENRHAE